MFVGRVLSEGIALAEVDISDVVARLEPSLDRLAQHTCVLSDNKLIPPGYNVYAGQPLDANGRLRDPYFGEVERRVRQSMGIDDRWRAANDDGHIVVVYLEGGSGGPLHVDAPGASQRNLAYMTIPITLRGTGQLYVWDPRREFDSIDEVMREQALEVETRPGSVTGLRCSVSGNSRGAVWHRAEAPTSPDRMVLTLSYLTEDARLVEELTHDLA
jgi:hypothetical protein